jgi:hypothetical protein
LVDEVAAHHGHEFPTDCFCGKGGFHGTGSYGPTYEQGYRFSRRALEFVQEGVRAKMRPAVETPKEWRCYHCDEVFTAPVDAWHHFGGHETCATACQIKAPGEFALLEALRNAEDELARYRNEDSDIIRAMWATQSDHAAALRREEEKGYARGLRNARSGGETRESSDNAKDTLDAARYRHIRRSEAEMGPAQEQAFGEMWLKISHKGFEGEKMDRAVDRGIAAFLQATVEDGHGGSAEKSSGAGI